MKHIELHILQSVPFSCLNRDELGSPKTAEFGGVLRARLSSQSMKRAIRTLAKEIAGKRNLAQVFSGVRTRYVVRPFLEALCNADALAKKQLSPLPPQEAERCALRLSEYLNKLDEAEGDLGVRRVKTALFLSPGEIAEAAAKFLTKKQTDLAGKTLEEWLSTDPGKKKVKAAIKSSFEVKFNDAADIALFGRMVANDDSLNVEAAALFAHALSTHTVENDFDFFSAVDEAKPADAAFGAAITDNLEANSACYYRFAALNVAHLADSDNNLAAVPAEALRDVVDIFLRATLMALPSARKATMNGDTLPEVVLGVVKADGHPVQLVNAFEEPVRAGRPGGFVAESGERMLRKHKRLVEGYSLGPEIKTHILLNLSERFAPKLGEVAIKDAPQVKAASNIDEFCKELLDHAL
jgi:CRISPR system Cascade subunit CasC